MNTKELTYLLQHPEKITREQTNSLENLSRAFPYFQPIRPLILKALKNQESFRYNQELKTAAAYTSNRSVLFDFITSDLFKKDKEQQDTIQKSRSDITVVDPQEIKALPRMDMDDAVRMKIEEAEDVLDPTLFSARREESTLKQVEIAEESSIVDSHENQQPPLEKEKTPEETLEIDKPLDFSKKETHSFAEWLKLTSIKPLDEEKKTENEISASENEEKELEKPLQKRDKFELIDEFIANNPKIQPVSKNAPKRNLAKENVVSNDELMTETLARVYLAQKNYKKAIQAYNILILKNPEKSGFFADQIRAIKKIQENTRK